MLTDIFHTRKHGKMHRTRFTDIFYISWNIEKILECVVSGYRKSTSNTEKKRASATKNFHILIFCLRQKMKCLGFIPWVYAGNVLLLFGTLERIFRKEFIRKISGREECRKISTSIAIIDVRARDCGPRNIKLSALIFFLSIAINSDDHLDSIIATLGKSPRSPLQHFINV